MVKDALIIGGGIAGLQTAINLADAGYPVQLVTSDSALGGLLTGDQPAAGCWADPAGISALVLGGSLHAASTVVGSLLLRVRANPLIQIYPAARLVEFFGAAGRFTAVVEQGGPAKRRVRLAVGAVIVAPGFRMFDAAAKREYGYGFYPNVITSREFEQKLAAARFGGGITRPADGGRAANMAVIQCVGSRDVVSQADYCSGICCLFTVKQALMAKELDPALKLTVYYIDIRAGGQNFDRFWTAARNRGTQYVRAMVSEVKEDPVSHDLLLKHLADGEIVATAYDLVVLATGVRPAAGLAATAGLLGLELDKYGFLAVNPLTQPLTGRPGILAVGGRPGEMEVAETLARAGAAAAAARTVLGPPDRSRRRPEPPVPGGKPDGERAAGIGVFLCDGGLLAMGADPAAVAARVAQLPAVGLTRRAPALCSPAGLALLGAAVAQNSLSRVVVSPCMVRGGQELFQETAARAGLNRALVNLAVITRQGWPRSPAAADDAAVDLTGRAVAEVKTYRPLYWHAEPVTPHALIVGGGLSGLTAALALAGQGLTATVVEKTAELGGYIKSRPGVDPDDREAERLAADLISQALASDRLEILRPAEVTAFHGHQGNFSVQITQRLGEEISVRQLDHGAVILATGTVAAVPAEYLYGVDERVVTGEEAQMMVAAGKWPAGGDEVYAFIQCVGSRTENRAYCSRTCCRQTVVTAKKIREINPAAQVYVFYRDLRLPGYEELKYQAAREAGVIFFPYRETAQPELRRNDEGELVLTAREAVSGLTVTISPAKVILAAGQAPPPATAALARLLGLQVSEDGFFRETHAGLGTIGFPGGGIWVAGAAQGPKPAAACIAQARGVAARAAGLLARRVLRLGGIIAEVDESKCAACLTCVRVCPFGVPRLDRAKKPMGAAAISPAACRGCGICAAECPNRAITLRHYEDDQLRARVAALWPEEAE